MAYQCPNCYAELYLQEIHDNFDEYECPRCQREYFMCPEGLFRFAEADPCEMGYHDWHETHYLEEDILECRRCGLIDA